MTDASLPRCAKCGFLTMRSVFTRQLDEMDSDFRETGNPPRRKEIIVGGVGQKVSEYTTTPYRNVPICFALSVNLADEYPASADLQEKYQDWPAGTVLDVLSKERPECVGKFTQWQQGFTPKEHLEMLDRRSMTEREDRRDRDMREREDRRDAELRRLQERLHNRELLIIGGLVTIALVIGSIAAAIIEGAVSRGFEPSWWPF